MPEIPSLIGIAGPSCSGKTTLAQSLAAVQPGPAAILSLDSYYRDLSHLPLAARHHFNFDVPEALDHELLVQNLQGLARGRAVEQPVYLFPEHVRAPRGERVEPVAHLIVEGLFALYFEEIRSLLDTRIFIQVDDSVCLQRRQQRDTRERGRTPESVLEQYTGTVRPMYERHVRPTQQFADLVVRGEQPVAQSAVAVVAHIKENSP